MKFDLMQRPRNDKLVFSIDNLNVHDLDDAVTSRHVEISSKTIVISSKKLRNLETDSCLSTQRFSQSRIKRRFAPTSGASLVFSMKQWSLFAKALINVLTSLIVPTVFRIACTIEPLDSERFRHVSYNVHTKQSGILS